MTLKKDVEELLKSGRYSNYQLQMEVHSSSADRAARSIRQNPPAGYVFLQRPKEKVIGGQRPRLEYILAPEGNN